MIRLKQLNYYVPYSAKVDITISVIRKNIWRFERFEPAPSMFPEKVLQVLLFLGLYWKDSFASTIVIRTIHKNFCN